MRPSDTSPEAWKVQIEIMRRKGPLERLRIACRMSDELHAWEMRQTGSRQVASQKPD
ncbi:MAG TPA: hypothetical protein VN931_05450 [Fibrobacteria bacterium]|nr:hypothetical protein [Fibrobacteria bacterium]